MGWDLGSWWDFRCCCGIIVFKKVGGLTFVSIFLKYTNFSLATSFYSSKQVNSLTHFPDCSFFINSTLIQTLCQGINHPHPIGLFMAVNLMLLPLSKAKAV